MQVTSQGSPGSHDILIDAPGGSFHSSPTDTADESTSHNPMFLPGSKLKLGIDLSHLNSPASSDINGYLQEPSDDQQSLKDQLESDNSRASTPILHSVRAVNRLGQSHASSLMGTPRKLYETPSSDNKTSHSTIKSDVGSSKSSSSAATPQSRHSIFSTGGSKRSPVTPAERKTLPSPWALSKNSPGSSTKDGSSGTKAASSKPSPSLSPRPTPLPKETGRPSSAKPSPSTSAKNSIHRDTSTGTAAMRQTPVAASPASSLRGTKADHETPIRSPSAAASMKSSSSSSPVKSNKATPSTANSGAARSSVGSRHALTKSMDSALDTADPRRYSIDSSTHEQFCLRVNPDDGHSQALPIMMLDDLLSDSQTTTPPSEQLLAYPVIVQEHAHAAGQTTVSDALIGVTLASPTPTDTAAKNALLSREADLLITAPTTGSELEAMSEQTDNLLLQLAVGQLCLHQFDAGLKQAMPVPLSQSSEEEEEAEQPIQRPEAADGLQAPQPAAHHASSTAALTDPSVIAEAVPVGSSAGDAVHTCSSADAATGDPTPAVSTVGSPGQSNEPTVLPIQQHAQSTPPTASPVRPSSPAVTAQQPADNESRPSSFEMHSPRLHQALLATAASTADADRPPSRHSNCSAADLAPMTLQHLQHTTAGSEAAESPSTADREAPGISNPHRKPEGLGGAGTNDPARIHEHDAQVSPSRSVPASPAPLQQPPAASHGDPAAGHSSDAPKSSFGLGALFCCGPTQLPSPPQEPGQCPSTPTPNGAAVSFEILADSSIRSPAAVQMPTDPGLHNPENHGDEPVQDVLRAVFTRQVKAAEAPPATEQPLSGARQPDPTYQSFQDVVQQRSPAAGVRQVQRIDSKGEGMVSQYAEVLSVRAELARAHEERSQLYEAQSKNKCTIIKLESLVNSKERSILQQAAELERLRERCQQLDQELAAATAGLDVTPERCRVAKEQLAEQATIAQQQARAAGQQTKKTEEQVEWLQKQAAEAQELVEFMRAEQELLEEALAVEANASAQATSQLAAMTAQVGELQLRLQETTAELHDTKERIIETELLGAQHRDAAAALQLRCTAAETRCLAAERDKEAAVSNLRKAEKELTDVADYSGRMFREVRGILLAMEKHSSTMAKLPEVSVLLQNLRSWVAQHQRAFEQSAGRTPSQSQGPPSSAARSGSIM